MRFLVKKITFFCISFAFFSQITAFAATEAKEHPDIELAASVNGTPITQGLIDINVRAAVAQGQRDTPQLRQSIKDELINRTLIAQDAIKQGLDKEIDFRDQYTQLKLSLLLQAYIDGYLKTNPITEAKLQEEYQKQKELMGGGDTSSQYLLSQIVLNAESEAIAVISRLQNGDSFAKVAKEVSRDSSKTNGGVIGWVTLQQVALPIADTLKNLSKGAISASPIKVQNLRLIQNKVLYSLLVRHLVLLLV